MFYYSRPSFAGIPPSSLFSKSWQVYGGAFFAVVIDFGVHPWRGMESPLSIGSLLLGIRWWNLFRRLARVDGILVFFGFIFLQVAGGSNLKVIFFAVIGVIWMLSTTIFSCSWMQIWVMFHPIGYCFTSWRNLWENVCWCRLSISCDWVLCWCGADQGWPCGRACPLGLGLIVVFYFILRVDILWFGNVGLIIEGDRVDVFYFCEWVQRWVDPWEWALRKLTAI